MHKLILRIAALAMLAAVFGSPAMTPTAEAANCTNGQVNFTAQKASSSGDSRYDMAVDMFGQSVYKVLWDVFHSEVTDSPYFTKTRHHKSKPDNAQPWYVQVWRERFTNTQTNDLTKFALSPESISFIRMSDQTKCIIPEAPYEYYSVMPTTFAFVPRDPTQAELAIIDKLDPEVEKYGPMFADSLFAPLGAAVTPQPCGVGQCNEWNTPEPFEINMRWRGEGAKTFNFLETNLQHNIRPNDEDVGAVTSVNTCTYESWARRVLIKWNYVSGDETRVTDPAYFPIAVGSNFSSKTINGKTCQVVTVDA